MLSRRDTVLPRLHLSRWHRVGSEGTRLCWLRRRRNEATGAEVHPGGGAEVSHFGRRRLELGSDLLTAETG